MPPQPTQRPDSIARTLGRIIVVPLGLLLAVMGTMATLLTLGLEKITHAVHGRTLDAGSADAALNVLMDVHSLASVATFVPAVLVVIVGEIARIRSALYYMAGGGIAMAVMPLMKRTIGIEGIGLVWQVFATAGFVGGAVYWLVAGRRA